MNYTLLHADYNPDTKISTVTIGTDLGHFTATSLCHKEDLSYESKFFGCQIAEWKAIRKYCKAKRRLASERYEALVAFKALMEGTRNYDAHCYWAQKLRAQIGNAKIEVTKWEQCIRNANIAIVTGIEERDRQAASWGKWRQ